MIILRNKDINSPTDNIMFCTIISSWKIRQFFYHVMENRRLVFYSQSVKKLCTKLLPWNYL